MAQAAKRYKEGGDPGSFSHRRAKSLLSESFSLNEKSNTERDRVLRLKKLKDFNLAESAATNLNEESGGEDELKFKALGSYTQK